MRETYFLFENGQKKEINSHDLYYYYKDKGLVEMSDIKYVGWVRQEFIPKRMSLGDNVFYKDEVPYDRKIVAKNNKEELIFSSIEEAIKYIKDNKLSSASDGRILSTIQKNLEGKTKSGYKMSWSIK